MLKRREPRTVDGLHIWTQVPDYWQLTRLLRARLVQPSCRRTGQQRDKVAPPKRNELHETPNSQSEF
jgi:hypothetical protein